MIIIIIVITPSTYYMKKKSFNRYQIRDGKKEENNDEFEEIIFRSGIFASFLHKKYYIYHLPTYQPMRKDLLHKKVHNYV